MRRLMVVDRIRCIDSDMPCWSHPCRLVRWAGDSGGQLMYIVVDRQDSRWWRLQAVRPCMSWDIPPPARWGNTATRFGATRLRLTNEAKRPWLKLETRWKLVFSR